MNATLVQRKTQTRLPVPERCSCYGTDDCTMREGIRAEGRYLLFGFDCRECVDDMFDVLTEQDDALLPYLERRDATTLALCCTDAAMAAEHASNEACECACLEMSA